MDQQLVGPDLAAAQSREPVADPLVEPAEVLVFVPQRLLRAAAALGNPLRQLDHLEDCLLAVQSHDVVVGQPADIGLALALAAGQHLDEHRHHHFRPTLADQRQGAVEIEQNVTDVRPRAEPRAELDKAGKRRRIFLGRDGHTIQAFPNNCLRLHLSTEKCGTEKWEKEFEERKKGKWQKGRLTKRK